jgi:hypothetical protein
MIYRINIKFKSNYIDLLLDLSKDTALSIFRIKNSQMHIYDEYFH